VFERQYFGAGYFQPNYWISGTGEAPPTTSAGATRRRRAYQRLLARRTRELDRLEGEQKTVQAKLAALPVAQPARRQWATLGIDALPALDRVKLQSELSQIADRIEMQRALIARMRAAFEEQDEDDALMLLL
jgi:hypothetical protein